jgi:hypothetical protein
LKTPSVLCVSSAHAADYGLQPDRIGAWGCAPAAGSPLCWASLPHRPVGGRRRLHSTSRAGYRPSYSMDGIANARSNYANSLDEGLSILGLSD